MLICDKEVYCDPSWTSGSKLFLQKELTASQKTLSVDIRLDSKYTFAIAR